MGSAFHFSYSLFSFFLFILRFPHFRFLGFSCCFSASVFSPCFISSFLFPLFWFSFITTASHSLSSLLFSLRLCFPIFLYSFGIFFYYDFSFLLLFLALFIPLFFSHFLFYHFISFFFDSTFLLIALFPPFLLLFPDFCLLRLSFCFPFLPSLPLPLPDAPHTEHCHCISSLCQAEGAAVLLGAIPYRTLWTLARWRHRKDPSDRALLRPVVFTLFCSRNPTCHFSSTLYLRIVVGI